MHGTLGTLAERVGDAGLTAPTLVIIGEVASLGETLAWFEPKRSGDHQAHG